MRARQVILPNAQRNRPSLPASPQGCVFRPGRRVPRCLTPVIISPESHLVWGTCE